MPLESCISTPGFEWKCPKCGKLTQFFDDDHAHIPYESLPEEGKALCRERGWAKVGGDA